MKTIFKKFTVLLLSLALCFTAVFAGCGEQANSSGNSPVEQAKAKVTVVKALNSVSPSAANYFKLSGKAITTDNGKLKSSEILAQGVIKFKDDFSGFETLKADMFMRYVGDELIGEAQFYRDGKIYGQGFSENGYLDFKTIADVKAEISDMLASDEYKLHFIGNVDFPSDGTPDGVTPDTGEGGSSGFAGADIDYSKLMAFSESLYKGIIALTDISIDGDVYTIDILSTVNKVLNYVKAITALIDANPDLTLGELYNSAAVQAIALPVLGSIPAKELLDFILAVPGADAEIIKLGIVLPDAGTLNANEYIKNVLTGCSFVYGEGDNVITVPVGEVKVRDMFKGNGGDISTDRPAEWTNITPAIDKAIKEINDVLKILKISLTVKGDAITAFGLKLKFEAPYKYGNAATGETIEGKEIVDAEIKVELLDKMPELLNVDKNLPAATDGGKTDVPGGNDNP